MFKYIFLLIILLMNNVYSWEQISPSNSPLRGTFVPRLFFDKDSVMWIAEYINNDFFAYKDGKMIDYTSKLPAFVNFKQVKQFHQDKRGNMIFWTKECITVFDGTNWYSTPEKYLKAEGNGHLFLFTEGILCHDDKIFLFYPVLDRLVYFQYDEQKGKYNFDDTLSFPVKSGIPNSFAGGKIRYISSIKDSSHTMIVTTSKYILEYNYITGEWRFLIDNNGKEVTYFEYISSNRSHLVDNIYYVQSVKDKIIRVDTNNKVDVFPLSGDPNDVSTVAGLLVLPEHKGILVTKTTGLYYINEAGKRFYIPPPPDMIEYGWLLHELSYDGKYVWIGSYYGGIYKFTIDELLGSIIPLSVEIPSYLPSLDILNFYPNPVTKNELNVEMVLENTTKSDLKMNIYDIDGVNVGTPFVEEHHILNDVSQLKLSIPKLCKGVYFITFETKKGFKAKSFVIE